MSIRLRVQVGSRYSQPSPSSGDDGSMLWAMLVVIVLCFVVFGCLGLALFGGAS